MFRGLRAMAMVSMQKTILVVDDDPEILEYASEVLRECGYAVLGAADGVAALSLLKGGGRVDLLFTDVIMPGIDGFEVARRAVQQRPSLKVLFTSGYVAEPPRAARLLKKPYRPQQLAGEVEAALGR